MRLGKNVLILGSGASALSAVNVLKSLRSNKIFLYDPKKSSKTVRKYSLENKLSSLSIIDNQKELKKNARSFSCAIISPGISLKESIPLFLIKLGIPLISEIELSLHFLESKKKIIGITGTNGKSTTTSVLTHILSENKKKAVSTGNFGLPLGMVTKSKKYDYFITEMSSYQIETSFKKRFDGTLFLNISEDHLERYGDMETYFKAKWKLLHLTKESGFSILTESVLKIALSLELPLPDCSLYIIRKSHDKETKSLNFSASKNKVTEKSPYLEILRWNAFIKLYKENISYISLDKKGVSLDFTRDGERYKTLSLKKCSLYGEHNMENMAFAASAALCLGIKNIENTFSTYKNLPHRFEEIRIKNKKNLSFINDSKSTNLNSLRMALAVAPKKVHLLMGGQIKEESFESIQKILKSKVIKIYPFGESAHFIYDTLKREGHNLHKASSKMSSALLAACLCAQSKDLILFSPAGASFDEFKNFEERGQIFSAELIKMTKDKLI
jgi:UDP-N-acetylmuramoylalanine--D-glutamate ligase